MISHDEAFNCAGRSADLEELSSEGYLLEANRRFFHRLGLHLCVRITGDEEEPFRLALLNRREVPGGLYYGRSDEDPGLEAVLSARRRKAAVCLERLWARNAAAAGGNADSFGSRSRICREWREAVTWPASESSRSSA